MICMLYCCYMRDKKTTWKKRQKGKENTLKMRSHIAGKDKFHEASIDTRYSRFYKQQSKKKKKNQIWQLVYYLCETT